MQVSRIFIELVIFEQRDVEVQMENDNSSNGIIVVPGINVRGWGWVTSSGDSPHGGGSKVSGWSSAHGTRHPFMSFQEYGVPTWYRHYCMRTGRGVDFYEDRSAYAYILPEHGARMKPQSFIFNPTTCIFLYIS